jgi:uncharacterized membrane protein YgcG
MMNNNENAVMLADFLEKGACRLLIIFINPQGQLSPTTIYPGVTKSKVNMMLRSHACQLRGCENVSCSYMLAVWDLFIMAVRERGRGGRGKGRAKGKGGRKGKGGGEREAGRGKGGGGRQRMGESG